MTLSATIALPDNFRLADFLAFHQRDQQAIAEQVMARSLRKGVVWQGQPACLTVEFTDAKALATLEVGTAGTTSERDKLLHTLQHMLGLTQPVAQFEQAHRNHPQLGPLISKQPGLRVPQAFSAFEALTWAVTGQQITVSAAVALRRKLILAAGIRHASGIACYPDAHSLASLDEGVLRQAGFSTSKAQTLLLLSRLVNDGQLPLESQPEPLPVDAITASLLAIRGIGPWTVNYALLRGYAWLDGSLHGDAGVRRGLKTLLGSEADITEKQAQQWLEPFTPWRALVAAHLWAMSAPES